MGLASSQRCRCNWSATHATAPEQPAEQLLDIWDFANAPVEVDGRRVQFVITKDSVISQALGDMTGTGQPLNFTLVRSEVVSGTCEGATIYTPP